jgi:hypothetical protein
MHSFFEGLKYFRYIRTKCDHAAKIGLRMLIRLNFKSFTRLLQRHYMQNQKAAEVRILQPGLSFDYMLILEVKINQLCKLCT